MHRMPDLPERLQTRHANLAKHAANPSTGAENEYRRDGHQRSLIIRQLPHAGSNWLHCVICICTVISSLKYCFFRGVLDGSRVNAGFALLGRHKVQDILITNFCGLLVPLQPLAHLPDSIRSILLGGCVIQRSGPHQGAYRGKV